MPVLEAGVAVLRGHLKENFSIPFPKDAYYDVVFIPGFSDTHAHPQVVDAGLRPGLLWSNSYEWLMTRDLAVDEAAVRNDIGLSSWLAELAMKRALLEGVTLIAFTGRFEGNLKAFTRMKVTPRLVLLPTVMRRRGWATPRDIKQALSSYRKYMGDELLRPGIFVHSIAYGGPDMIRDSFKLAEQLRGPLGIHLSEGVSERRDFEEIAGDLVRNVRVVAVHCLNDDYRDLGLRCSSCPGSNLALYARYLDDLDRITSFGSDWPHLLGTTGSLVPLIYKIYGRRESELLYKLTVGGYNDYGVPYNGDLVAFDGTLRSVLEGRSRPRLVSVAGRIAVDEGALTWSGETLRDVENEVFEAIRYSVDVYGTGETPWIPAMEDLLSLVEGRAKAAR